MISISDRNFPNYSYEKIVHSASENNDSQHTHRGAVWGYDFFKQIACASIITYD